MNGSRLPIIQYSFEIINDDGMIFNEGLLGESYNGTIHTTTNTSSLLSEECAIGTRCLQLNAQNEEYVSVATPLALSGKDWTVCFWYKKSADTLTETNACVFVMCDDANENELSVQFLGTNGFDTSGRLDLSVCGNSVTQIFTNCCDDTWRHVCIVYDSTLSTYFIYFNGIMCYYPVKSSFVIGENISRTVFNIGKCSNSNYYNSISIDDFRIYDEIALSLCEIAEVCGNNNMYSYQQSQYFLLNTLLDCYLPNTTNASATNHKIKLGNSYVDLNTLYARYTITSGAIAPSKGLCCRFVPNFLQGCCNFFSADIADGGLVLNSENGTVIRWKDLSGNSNDAVSSKGPVYNSNDSYMDTMSVKQCLYYNGTTAGPCLTCPSGGFSSYGATFCFVIYPIAGVTTGAPGLIATSGTYTLGSTRLLWLMNSLMLYNYMYPNATTYTSLFDSGKPCILVLTYLNNGGTCTITLYKDGTNTPIVSNVTIISSPINLTSLDIGRCIYNGNCSFWGGISSLVVFDRVLSINEIRLMEGYLAWKWWNHGNCVLPTTHPYINGPPLDTAYVFNPRYAVTNTIPVAVLCVYGSAPWYDTFGAPFNNEHNWIYTSINDLTDCTTSQLSIQQSCLSCYSTAKSATLSVLVAGTLIACYVNGTNVMSSYQVDTTSTYTVTLVPGPNLFDFYCQQTTPSSAGGLVFNVVSSVTCEVLMKSDCNAKYRLFMW